MTIQTTKSEPSQWLWYSW